MVSIEQLIDDAKCYEVVRNLHTFRRTFALQSLPNGCDIYSLMRMMGHYLLTFVPDISMLCLAPGWSPSGF